VGPVSRLLERLGVRPVGDPPSGADAHAAGTRAFVVLDLDYAAGVLHLVLANTGAEAALDVSVTFDRPVVGLGGQLDFAKVPLFSGLSVLRPGREIRLLCEAGPAITGIGRFRATVRWSTPDGGRHRADFEHDTALYRLWPERTS
jgi:hypothetical protein